MMKLATLKDLYIHELSDLYDAENQLVKALPNMATAASSPELRSAFEKHLHQTQEHVNRLERIFSMSAQEPMRLTCKGMKGLIEEENELIKENGDQAVKDAALIAAAQRVEHYEIAGYGCARTYAEMLGDKTSAQLLQTTLDEEHTTDESLTQLAESVINTEAAQA